MASVTQVSTEPPRKRRRCNEYISSGRTSQPARLFPANSKCGTLDGEIVFEPVFLTEKNLRTLNEPCTKHPSPESCSTVSTAYRTEQEEYWDNLMRQRYGDPVPCQRTPSPSPPSDAPVSRKQEKPRPVKPVHTTRHEPHQCPLGIACLLDVDSLNYHRLMATQLVAKARRARLPVHAVEASDYDDVKSLKDFSRYAGKLLLEKCQRWRLPRLNPLTVLREIQSPDYWETERRYLETPGCLAERQKTLPHQQTVDFSDGSLNQESTTTGDGFTQQKAGRITGPNRDQEPTPVLGKRRSIDDDSPAKRQKTSATVSAPPAKPSRTPKTKNKPHTRHQTNDSRKLANIQSHPDGARGISTTLGLRRSARIAKLQSAERETKENQQKVASSRNFANGPRSKQSNVIINPG